MKQVFRLDGPIFQMMNRIGDLVVLNLLCLLFSVPIITMGASFTAMDQVLIKLNRKEEPKLIQTFFLAFRNSFFQSTKVWLFFLFCGIVLAADLLLSQSMKPPFQKIFFYLSGCGSIVLLGNLLYAFALVARFQNSMRQTIKNAFLLSIAQGPRTIGMILCWFVPVIVGLSRPVMLIYTILFMLLIGVALIRSINIRIIDKIIMGLEGGKQ